jgi:nucleotide-binding universal stress UspA family protein
MFKTIFVAVDGSEHSNRAVDCAASLASKYDAELIILHVVPTLGSARVPPELRELAHAEHIELTEVDLLKGAADQILQTAELRTRGHGVEKVRTSMGIGQIAESIVMHAKAEGADLLVMGRRGVGSVRSLILGSTTQMVMNLSACACLMVV